jgi:hypothetical protein
MTLLLSCGCLGDEDNSRAFSRHFESECAVYQQVACVSLLDLLGKEKVVADSFLRHMLLLDSPRLTYVAFDFHDYW